MADVDYMKQKMASVMTFGRASFCFQVSISPALTQMYRNVRESHKREYIYFGVRFLRIVYVNSLIDRKARPSTNRKDRFP